MLRRVSSIQSLRVHRNLFILHDAEEQPHPSLYQIKFTPSNLAGSSCKCSFELDDDQIHYCGTMSQCSDYNYKAVVVAMVAPDCILCNQVSTYIHISIPSILQAALSSLYPTVHIRSRFEVYVQRDKINVVRSLSPMTGSYPQPHSTSL